MKIAIVGTGIAGNLAARELARDHEITVFEADQRIGGHVHTVELEHGGKSWSVDTGFIVYNERTYPNFCRLLDELQVPTRESRMSFSVRCERSGLEYCGHTLNTLFAQRRNLLRPSFHRMIRDILRFNREAPTLLDGPDENLSLGSYLVRESYSREFVEHYILPMGAAIWSAEPRRLRGMPAGFFVRFFHNHGMLDLKDRPVWRVIQGGSVNYMNRLIAGHRERIRAGMPVRRLRREEDAVWVECEGHAPERFDQVFLACHSDEALALLEKPTEAEREVLGAIPYQANEAVLHTDASLMPRRRLAWAAWNYHLPAEPKKQVALSYNMNILQGLDAPVDFCVTLNNTEAIAPEHVIRRISYRHPVFTPEGIAAQQRHKELNGTQRTWYCGAYWRNGFHEDGVVSALAALEHFHEQHGTQELHLRGARVAPADCAG